MSDLGGGGTQGKWGEGVGGRWYGLEFEEIATGEQPPGGNTLTSFFTRWSAET